MRGLKLTGRILSGILLILLGLLLICNLYILAARALTGKQQPTVFGYSFAVVVSGSMSGSIEVDDMIITRREECYAVGDIITFESGSRLVTHRITGESSTGFITKGDANNTEDAEEVKKDSIVGKVVLVIPKIGRCIGYLRTPLGMCCLVLIGFVLIEIPALVGRRKKVTTGGNIDGESNNQ